MSITFQGAVQVGGMSQVWEYNQEWDRIEFFEYVTQNTYHTTVSIYYYTIILL